MTARRALAVTMAATLAACASATTARTVAPSSPSHAVTPSSTRATSTPTPSLTPVLGILSTTISLDAVDASGHVQWSLTEAEVNSLVAATATDRVTVRIAGPSVIVSRIPTQTNGAGNLVVLDSTGVQLGAGTFTPNGFEDDVFGGPTGTEWAWSVDDTPLGVSRHHGRIVVAGIGVAAHSVFSWVAPAGAFTELVAGWTDMGIVMERIGSGGCGAGFHPDAASFLVDPVTGTLTNLFTTGDHYGDARHQVRAAFRAQSQSAVTVNGATYDEPHTVANSVFVSPDGAYVGVQRFSLLGCAGTVPTLSTQLITVAAGTRTDVAGCGIEGWFDAAHFVCHAFSSLLEKLVGVDGQAVATLGNGGFIGALTGG